MKKFSSLFLHIANTREQADTVAFGLVPSKLALVPITQPSSLTRRAKSSQTQNCS